MRMETSIGDALGRELVITSSRILPRSRDSLRANSYRAGERYQLCGVWISDNFGEREGDEEYVVMLRSFDTGAHLLCPWSCIWSDSELVP